MRDAEVVIATNRNITVSGKTFLFSLPQAGVPGLRAEIKGTGGKAATAVRLRGPTDGIADSQPARLQRVLRLQEQYPKTLVPKGRRPDQMNRLVMVCKPFE